MKEFDRREYNAVLWVIENTSPMVLDERFRVYFERARDKEADFYYSQYSDNEIFAVCSALEYYEKLYTELVRERLDADSTKKKIMATVQAINGARCKMLKVLAERKNRSLGKK